MDIERANDDLFRQLLEKEEPTPFEILVMKGRVALSRLSPRLFETQHRGSRKPKGIAGFNLSLVELKCRRTRLEREAQA